MERAPLGLAPKLASGDQPSRAFTWAAIAFACYALPVIFKLVSESVGRIPEVGAGLEPVFLGSTLLVGPVCYAIGAVNHARTTKRVHAALPILGLMCAILLLWEDPGFGPSVARSVFPLRPVQIASLFGIALSFLGEVTAALIRKPGVIAGVRVEGDLLASAALRITPREQRGEDDPSATEKEESAEGGSARAEHRAP